MALWAAVIGGGMVALELIVTDLGWAQPTGTPTASVSNVMPTSDPASQSAPITSPITSSPTASSPSTGSPSTGSPTAGPSREPQTTPVVKPSKNKSNGTSSERSAKERAPVGRYQGSRVVPPTSAEASGAAAVPPRSPAPSGQGGEIAVQSRYLSQAVAQGLIFGGAAGFLVSLTGMVLVGWIRRQV